MNDLEQQLTDELGAIATDLGGPHVDTSGLTAAGRREQVRRRVLTGVLAGAAVVVLVAGLAVALPDDGPLNPSPAPAPTRGLDHLDLGRPLELPWWGSADGSVDPSAGLLRVGDDQIPVDDATAVVHVGEVTLVEQGQGSWGVLDRGALRPLSDDGITVPPVVGADGDIAYVVADEGGSYAVVRESDSESAGQSVTASARPVAVGITGDRVFLTTGDGLWFWKDGTSSLQQVTGLPRQVRASDGIEPRPGGLAVRSDDTVIAGAVDGTRFRALWETPSDGTGVWSDDGEQYAEADDKGVRFSTKAGTTVASLEQDRLRVVGWESDSEVVVAQWIEEDQAVTGLWRCSAVELRCEEVDGPNGKALLPGLPGA